MNHNIILFGLLAIIFIVIITLSLKLNSLRRNRLLPCDNEKTNINILDEYNENLNDTPLKVSEHRGSAKKIKFNNTVKVRVFG